MRDLKAYPVTTDEIVEHLQTLKGSAEKCGGIGDMGALLLQEAIKSVIRDNTPTNDLGLTEEL